MYIHEIANKYNIGIRKLRRMKKAGALICDEDGEEDLLPKMRAYLAKRQRLTVMQLVALVEQPSLLWGLGRYQPEARMQLAELGDAISDLPPKEITAEIFTAAKGDRHSIAVLVGWLKGVIPSHRVSYYWVGVRLLLSVPENCRKEHFPLISPAVSRCCKHPDFAGWSCVETVGHRRQSFFRRPEASFDL